MAQVVVTPNAWRGMERCRQFLVDRNPLAARRAAEEFKRQLRALETHPEIGRPHNDMPELRELLIPFGNAGYVALYRYLPGEDAVYLLAFRHQKEAGH